MGMSGKRVPDPYGCYSQDEEMMRDLEKIPTIFTFNQTPVKARPGFWPMVLGVWAILSWLGRWRWPGQTWSAYLLVGGIGTVLGMLVDVGHACAHTIGARLAHAPMDVVLLGADMPRTLYWNNDVSPRVHIMRSLGGPVYSGIGLLIGLVWLWLVPRGTAVRYLGEIWTIGNGFIFLAIFAPLPIVDGGVILKWLLVIFGQTEVQADAWVRRLGLGFGAILLATAVFFLVQASWIVAGICLLVSLVVFASALNLIK